jgi:hypothetical protein
MAATKACVAGDPVLLTDTGQQRPCTAAVHWTMLHVAQHSCAFACRLLISVASSLQSTVPPEELPLEEPDEPPLDEPDEPPLEDPLEDPLDDPLDEPDEDPPLEEPAPEELPAWPPSPFPPLRTSVAPPQAIAARAMPPARRNRSLLPMVLTLPARAFASPGPRAASRDPHEPARNPRDA